MEERLGSIPRKLQGSMPAGGFLPTRWTWLHAEDEGGRGVFFVESAKNIK